MYKDIIIYESGEKNVNNIEYEVVERKGIGHPDTICDTLAELISQNYSKYTLEKYGCIFRHMIDKITILGGSSKVGFGFGNMTKQINILLNGRFTKNYLNEDIPFLNIARTTISNYFKVLFPMLDSKWINIVDNTHSSQGPGVVYDSMGSSKNERSSFFEINNKNNMYFHNNMNRTNDTSTSVSYYPLSNLEIIVIMIERILNSRFFKNKYKYIGNDIKVMGTRHKNHLDLTMCIPFISIYTLNLDFYINNINIIKEKCKQKINKYFPEYTINIHINTRDNYDNNDLYLTYTGSAIESGDEGAVGRGNRSNGVISFTRNMTVEACCGKNPVYHTGKLFTAIGNKISKKIYTELGISNSVFLTSQMGGDIKNPWKIAIKVENNTSVNLYNNINNIVTNELNNHYNTTLDLVYNNIKLYK